MTWPWVLDESDYLSLEEVKILRQYCKQEKQEALKQNSFLGVRNWFVVELGLQTGLRVQEMTDLKHGDVLASAFKASVVVREGKGHKKRTVWITESFKNDCQYFFRWKHWRGHPVGDDDYVLTSEKGLPVTKRAFQKAFMKIMRDAGLDNHYSIHCLRHTYATYLLKATGNIKFVQPQLGHASVRVTEVYANLILSEQIKKAMENLYK